uniref:Uncharacterized protein n=1 Tax=Pseudomonas phage HRDY3 TaxID=3236930 RepID=A0AB39CEJ9_9VIRU
MARAKKIETPAIDPAIAWNTDHDKMLVIAEKTFQLALDNLRLLQAAQHRGISSAELLTRIAAEFKRQEKIVARLKAATEEMGGTVSSAVDDGIFGREQYGWCFTFKTNTGHLIEFSYGRGMEADAYDLPLSFRWTVRYPKARFKTQRVATPENDHDYIDCENVGDFKRYVKRAVKWLNDTRGTDNKKVITLA